MLHHNSFGTSNMVGCVPTHFLWDGTCKTDMVEEDLPGDLETVNTDPMQPSRPCSPARKPVRVWVLMRHRVSCVGSRD